MTRFRVVGLLLTSSLLLASPLALAKKKKARRVRSRGRGIGRSAVEGPRARVQAVRRRGLLLGVDRAQQGHRGRVGRQRAQQAEGRVLDGQGPLQHEVLLGVAVVLRSHRPEGLRRTRYYNATLKWLASLSRQLPDSTGILEKIGKYNRAELDQPALEKVRDELYFLLGKFNYQKGKFKEAVELFAAVPTEQRVLRAGEAVRGRHARPRVPGQAGRRGVQGGAPRRRREQPTRSIKPFEDLANLSLARTFYSTGQYELATKYFDRVSQESYDWANSLFESSWANFMLKQQGYSKALGNIHTIQAPFFENYIKPESIGEGADGQGDHLLLQLPLRPRPGSDRRVQRDLPDGVHRAEEADRRHDREQPAVRRRRSRSARRRRGCPSRSSAPRAASSAT